MNKELNSEGDKRQILNVLETSSFPSHLSNKFGNNGYNLVLLVLLPPRMVSRHRHHACSFVVLSV